MSSDGLNWSVTTDPSSVRAGDHVALTGLERSSHDKRPRHTAHVLRLDGEGRHQLALLRYHRDGYEHWFPAEHLRVLTIYRAPGWQRDLLSDGTVSASYMSSECDGACLYCGHALAKHDGAPCFRCPVEIKFTDEWLRRCVPHDNSFRRITFIPGGALPTREQYLRHLQAGGERLTGSVEDWILQGSLTVARSVNQSCNGWHDDDVGGACCTHSLGCGLAGCQSLRR